MATKKKALTKKDLSALMKGIPAPIVEHCKRCKKLADFFINRIALEDWFIDLNISELSLKSAVYYHDIGKASISKDCFYYSDCDTNEKKDEYKDHVYAGLRLIKNKIGVDLEKSKGKATFEGILYQAIFEHHECVDGSGFPERKKGDQISFTGKFTAVVDTFDNLLLHGKEINLTVEDAIVELKKLADSGKLDYYLVETFLGDVTTLKHYVETEILGMDDQPGTNSYGISLRYSPIVHAANENTVSYLTSLVINDPFFGSISSDVFGAIAEKTKQIRQIDRIAVEKVFRTIFRAKCQGLSILTMYVNVSTQSLGMKSFLTFVEKYFKFYEIQDKQVYISIDETDLMNTEVDMAKVIEELHRIGLLVAINHFGEKASVVSTLSKLDINAVVFSPKITAKLYTDPKVFDIVNSLSQIPKKLGMRMSFDGVADSSQRQKILSTTGVYVAGPMYNEKMTENEFYDYLRSHQ